MKAIMVMFDSLNRRMLEPFAFTKGLKTLKVDAKARLDRKGADRQVEFPTALYDLEQDPGQESPIVDPDVEARLCAYMRNLMQANDAPPEQWVRLGLEP